MFMSIKDKVSKIKVGDTCYSSLIKQHVYFQVVQTLSERPELIRLFIKKRKPRSV